MDELTIIFTMFSVLLLLAILNNITEYNKTAKTNTRYQSNEALENFIQINYIIITFIIVQFSGSDIKYKAIYAFLLFSSIVNIIEAYRMRSSTEEMVLFVKYIFHEKDRTSGFSDFVTKLNYVTRYSGILLFTVFAFVRY